MSTFLQVHFTCANAPHLLITALWLESDHRWYALALRVFYLCLDSRKKLRGEFLSMYSYTHSVPGQLQAFHEKSIFQQHLLYKNSRLGMGRSILAVPTRARTFREWFSQKDNPRHRRHRPAQLPYPLKKAWIWQQAKIDSVFLWRALRQVILHLAYRFAWVMTGEKRQLSCAPW